MVYPQPRVEVCAEDDPYRFDCHGGAIEVLVEYLVALALVFGLPIAMFW